MFQLWSRRQTVKATRQGRPGDKELGNGQEYVDAEHDTYGAHDLGHQGLQTIGPELE